MVEGPHPPVSLALLPGQSGDGGPCSELEERKGLQRGRQHRDPQEGLLEPCQSGAAHHREVQHDAAERIWEESVDR